MRAVSEALQLNRCILQQAYIKGSYSSYAQLSNPWGQNQREIDITLPYPLVSAPKEKLLELTLFLGLAGVADVGLRAADGGESR